MSDAYSISQLTTYIREMFEVNENLQDIWVQGEVSNMRRASSGHWYFTLKDGGAQLKCVMWRTNTAHQSVLPDDGDAILAHGYVGVYDSQGVYQLYADSIRAVGAGMCLEGGVDRVIERCPERGEELLVLPPRVRLLGRGS